MAVGKTSAIARSSRDVRLVARGGQGPAGQTNAYERFLDALGSLVEAQAGEETFTLRMELDAIE